MKLNLDKEKLLELYDYYRDALLPIGVIVLCILLTILILIPQLLSSFGNRAQYELEKNKLQVLKDNLSYISALDSSGLEKDLTSSSLAIPPHPNFDSIIASIYYAAASSGMGVGQFQFSVAEKPTAETLPTIQIILKSTSGVEDTIAFIKDLYKTFPASSISSLRIGEKIKESSILFYYKPFVTKIEDNSMPIPKISSQDQEILKELSSWKKPETALAPAASSTSSGELSSDFPF
jgi:hypothetical protein